MFAEEVVLFISLDKNWIFSKAINLCIEVFSLKLNSAQCSVLFLIIYGGFGIFDDSARQIHTPHCDVHPRFEPQASGFSAAYF